MSKMEESASVTVPGPRRPSVPSSAECVLDECVQLDGSSDLAVTVVEAVAEARDQSPVELVPRIDDAVDTDGLERIFRSHHSLERSGWVTFFLCGCQVVLESDGRLRVFDRRSGSGP